MKFYNDKFIKIRKEKRWSISKLSQDSGISRKAIANWEKGISQPKLSSLKKICFSLNTDISEITSLPKDEKTNRNPEDNVLFSNEFKKMLNLSLDNKSISDAFETLNFLNTNFNNFYTITNAVLYNSNIATYVKDVNNNYLYANSAFLKLFNIKKNIILISELTDSDVLPACIARDNSKEDNYLITNNKKLNSTRRNFKVNQKGITCLVNKSPILDKNNKVIGLIGNILNIDKICKINTYKKIIQTIINSMEQGVWMASCIMNNNLFRITPLYINRSLEEKLGKNKQKLISEPKIFNELLHLKDLIPFLLNAEKNNNFNRTLTIFNVHENNSYIVKEHVIKIDNYLIGISSFQ